MAKVKNTTQEMIDLSARLMELISIKKDKGLTQKQIASEIGVSESQLTKYINGDIEIGLNSLVKLAKYFNCSTDYLIGKTETASTNEDIKTACKVTGLSQKAIKSLTEYLKLDKNILDFLSSFFEDGNTYLGLALITDYNEKHNDLMLNYNKSKEKITNLNNKEKALYQLSKFHKESELGYISFEMYSRIRIAINNYFLKKEKTNGKHNEKEE